MKRLWVLIGFLIFAGTSLLVVTKSLPLEKKNVANDQLPVILHIHTEVIPEVRPHEHTEHDEVSDPGHGVIFSAPEIITAEDMWAQGVRATVQNAPRTVLHHVNVVVYPPTYKMNPLNILHQPFGFSIGQDVQEPIVLPAPYATFIPKGSRIVVNGMLHDALPPEGPGGEYHNVQVSVDLLGLGFSATEARPTTSLYLSLVDADSRDRDSFSIPAHTVHYTRYANDLRDTGRATYTFPSDGTLVAMSAHLHAWEGGEKVTAYLNDVPLHSFTPAHSGPNPWDWHTERAVVLMRVRAGDILSISATYSNEHADLLEGAMGSLGASFAPEESALSSSLLKVVTSFPSSWY